MVGHQPKIAVLDKNIIKPPKSIYIDLDSNFLLNTTYLFCAPSNTAAPTFAKMQLRPLKLVLDVNVHSDKPCVPLHYIFWQYSVS